ncbi:ABC transporter ATP-binding protein [Treponema sp. TIM-1]|uniref:ABC transporter ATP-binding protein n=1 Tax=Treponema sp. TIM-1 TaxID=2898417 RepID=UPI00398165AB
MTQVKLKHIIKTYKKNTALDDVSLTLEPGTMTAVLGPSGCGKTTLLRILGGFLNADAGRIFFNDSDVTLLPPQDRGAALVFQNYALWPHMSVFDNIAYGLKLRKVPKQEIKERVHNIVALVDLDAEVLENSRRPAQLSGGQQQRVALARSLVIEPSLLLLDEPLSNLDAKVRSRLRIYIRELQQKIGITALYVTHDQEEALSIADKIVVMNKGKIMQIGTPEAIYSKPANVFVAEFIGDSTILQGTVGEDNTVILADTVISGIPIHSSDATTPVPGDAVNIIVRSADFKIFPVEQDVSDMENMLCFHAEVKSSMFIGSQYKNHIRLHNYSFFADWETDCSGRTVKLIIPKEKIRMFSF